MGCIIKYSYQLLFSLFALTHGQTLNFTVIGGYVNKTKTAQLNCQLSTALADVVDIFWNAKHAFNCVGGGCNPQLPSNYSDFSATQNDVAGTTVVTILNATKERDEVKWTCKYGTTLSADVNLTITCPASNSSRLIEESGYITLELICTCPYTSLDLTFYLGADSYTEVIPSKTVDKTACSSTYEASVNYTLILPLQHLKSYNGTFNVFVNNGFYTARFSGSRLYNFTAATTPPPDDALCQPGGALFIILDICIIISYIIMVILIIDLITWNKYSPSSKFMACVKIDHRCLRILYIVLFIVLVICEIVIIIVIIIGRQCGLILIVGLVLGLIIIAVTCIFLIVFIKTEVVIYDKDKIQNPRTSTNVKIAALLRPFFLISDVEWIGPKGNTLTTEGKYIIAQYNRDTGEASLTINNVSQDDNGSYICQAKILCIIAKDSIHILCDKETSMKTTGPSASHIRTQNKVEPKTTSKQINERLQPLPPVGGVVEVKLKLRQQPPPPKNIDAEDQNLQSNSANYEDAQGPPTGTVQLKRLTPLTSKQPTVQEEDTSEEKTKKTRKKKKKRKGQRNEENQDEETAELKGQRTSSEDQADEY